MNSPRHLPLKGCGKVVQAACGGTQVAILNGQFTQSNRKNNKSGRFVSEKFPLHCLACRIKNAFSNLSLQFESRAVAPHVASRWHRSAQFWMSGFQFVPIMSGLFVRLPF